MTPLRTSEMAAPPPTAQGSTIRLAVVDDSDEIRLLARLGLDEADGFSVVAEASDGAEALAVVDAHLPDVVVLDVAMPVMDGLQALAELRVRHPEIPVVMFSGFSERHLEDRARRLGAAAYVEKTGDLTRLAAELRRAAATRGSARSRERAEAPAPSDDADPPPASTSGPGDLPGPGGPGARVRASTDPARVARSRAAAVVAAAALFAAVTVVGVTAESLHSAGGLYVVPVALLAVRFQLRGAAVGTAIALLLLGGWAAQVPDYRPLDFALRAVAFGTVGTVVGIASTRVARLLRAQERDAAALVAANRRLAEVTEAARASNAGLSASNADLRQFGSVASHDLAEPLRTMGGFAQLLDRRYAPLLDDTGRQFVGHIVEGAARMQRLIEDLRDYSLTSQREVAQDAVPLDAVVTECVAALGGTIAERGARIDAGPLPTMLGDRSMLVVLVQNLVANAITFNRSPAPTVTLRGGTDGATAWISVADDGIGIDAAHHDQVFGLFQRLHTRDEYAGTGLGLAICRRVVERHGGTLHLDSAPGRGTTMTVHLAAAPGSGPGAGVP